MKENPFGAANVNAADLKGLSPLMFAAANNFSGITELMEPTYGDVDALERSTMQPNTGFGRPFKISGFNIESLKLSSL